MKVGAVLVCLGVAGLLGFAWLRNHDRQVRETAAARYSRDSLALAIADERAERAGQHTRDSLESARKLRERDAELRYARLRADSNAEELGRLLVSLPSVLQDSLQALAQRINAGWAAHLDADLAERAAADAALAIRDTRYAALEARYAADVSGLNAQLDEAMRQLDRALKRGSPGIVTRVVRAMPWLGGVAAGGYIVGHLTR